MIVLKMTLCTQDNQSRTKPNELEECLSVMAADTAEILILEVVFSSGKTILHGLLFIGGDDG